MTQPTLRAQKTNEVRQAPKQVATKQIAKDAVRGGPKTVKKDKRSGVGRGQKG